MASISVRPATEADLLPLTKLDLTYAAGTRLLALERTGSEPELTFSLRWRGGEPVERAYAELTVEGLRGALATRADAVFVAEDADELLGYLMILLPRWTDAAEVSDLAVHRPARRRGAGRALIDGAAAWARERELRALWVEPQGDAGEAIEFYLRLGFRVAGFNDRWNSNRDDEDGRQTVYLYLELS